MIEIPRSLVDSIREGNEKAFEEMLTIAYAPLYRFAESLLGSTDDAKDVVQEVLINVWRLGNRWNPSGKIMAYLFASVRNQAIKSHKSSSRYVPFPGSEEESVEDEPLNQLDELIDSEMQHDEVSKVELVISTLSERYRTVYILRYREGLSVSEIADILEISPKAAEHLIRRATSEVLERLKKISE